MRRSDWLATSSTAAVAAGAGLSRAALAQDAPIKIGLPAAHPNAGLIVAPNAPRWGSSPTSTGTAATIEP